MSELLLLILSTALVNNLALTHMVGMTPLVALSRRRDMARLMAWLTIIVLPVTTGVTTALEQYWLLPAHLDHLTLLIFVFVTTLIVLLFEPLFERLLPAQADRYKPCLPLLLTSNTVLGTALLNSVQQTSILEALAFGLGSGLGFAFLLNLFASQRERLAAADVPLPFRGHAIAFISLALTTMALLGLAGLVNL